MSNESRQPAPDASNSTPLDPNLPFRTAEYTSLRAEIQRRSDNQHQLLSITIVAAGTLFALGLQQDAGTAVPVLLIYPILAMFLATAWAHHDFSIRRIADYIRDHIERFVAGSGWETYVRSWHGKEKRPSYAERGIFLSSELAAVALAVLRLLAMPSAGAQPTLAFGQMPEQTIIIAAILILDALSGIRTYVVLRRIGREFDLVKQ